MSTDDISLESSAAGQNLEPDYKGWRKLPDVGTGSEVTAYKVGDHQNGCGVLRLRPTRDDTGDWVAVYDRFIEGDHEPITRLEQDTDVTIHDLPYNRFETEEEGEEYLQTLMDVGLEDVLQEYGLRHQTGC